jgi:hypothetical protein
MSDKNSQEKKIVSLWMDDYDGFFSDFDPRPYSQRALSDDFLTEAKKVVQEHKPGTFDITVLIPLGKRDKPTESILTTRLHLYFKKQEHIQEKDYKESLLKSILWVVTGFLFLTGATFSSYLGEQAFILHVVRVTLEPAGWFMAWSGMDNILYITKTTKHEREFNKKMAKAEIRFDAFSPR